MSTQLESATEKVYTSYHESLVKKLKTLRWEVETKIDALTAEALPPLPGEIKRQVDGICQHIQRNEKRWLKTSVPAYMSELKQMASHYLWEQIPQEPFLGRQSEIETALDRELEVAWHGIFPSPASPDAPDFLPWEPVGILGAALALTVYIWTSIHNFFLRLLGSGLSTGGGGAECDDIWKKTA